VKFECSTVQRFIHTGTSIGQIICVKLLLVQLGDASFDKMHHSRDRAITTGRTHTGWANAHGFHCNNFVYSQPIFIISAYVHCSKFATGGYIVCPPITVCVTALPCEILITTLFMFTYISQPITLVVIVVNFCRNFMSIILKESYLMNNTYL